MTQDVLIGGKSAEWLDRLTEADVPCAPVLTRNEVIRHPHVAALEIVEQYDHPQAGRLRQARAAARFSATPPAIRSGAPALGEHTDEVLGELGYSAEQIAGLRPRGRRAESHPPAAEAVMAQSDTVFAGSIPALYDRYLGPLIFEPYAADLATRRRERAGRARPRDRRRHRASDARAGGVAARRERDRRDRSQSGDARFRGGNAGRRARAMAAGRRAWRCRSRIARSMPSPVSSARCSSPTRSTGYREALRVLRPGGRFVFSVWDRIEENEFTDVVTEAVAALFPGDPPRFLARTPHGYHDVERIGAELAAAGFSRIAIETVAHRSRASSPRDPAIGFCQGTPLRNEIEARDPSRLAEATDEAAAALAARFGPGPIDGKIQALVITASR